MSTVISKMWIRILKASKVILLLGIVLTILAVINNSSSTFTLNFLRPNLNQTVEKALENAQGRYGIFIKNFKTGETYKLKESELFESGSLYKIWVMAAVLEKIKQGNLKEDEVLSQDIDELNRKFNIDPKEAELTQGKIELTVKSALEQMITISHNYSALLLLDLLGNSKIPSLVTPSDVAHFFEKLYKGEILGEQYSQRMIEILIRQKVVDRIPKYLPTDTKVAHKTGDTNFFEHDGGIVFSSKGDYIIVVLTETDSPFLAAEKIAQISKAVNDYFNR